VVAASVVAARVVAARVVASSVVSPLNVVAALVVSPSVVVGAAVVATVVSPLNVVAATVVSVWALANVMPGPLVTMSAAVVSLGAAVGSSSAPPHTEAPNSGRHRTRLPIQQLNRAGPSAPWQVSLRSQQLLCQQQSPHIQSQQQLQLGPHMPLQSFLHSQFVKGRTPHCPSLPAHVLPHCWAGQETCLHIPSLFMHGTRLAHDNWLLGEVSSSDERTAFA